MITRNSVHVAIGLGCLMSALPPNAPCGTTCPPPENPWTSSLSFTLRESYDSNIYLQDVEPYLAAVNAARAAGYVPAEPNAGSWITSITPKLELGYKPSPEFSFTASYSPEIAFFHSADEENFMAHRAALNFGGTTESGAIWEFTNAASYVDGSETGPVFARPGDVPAIGGIPIRERREQFLLREAFKLTIPTTLGFVRPVATYYLHDFRTGQRPSPAPSLYVYENYIDRSEVVAGLDLGFKNTEKTAWVLGYRFGVQDQYELLGVDSPYDSKIHRILAGFEGAPCDWLKLAVLAGPDIRDFKAGTPAAFQTDELLYYVDALVSITPTKVDTFTFMARRYEQPAFSSHSMYEDITYDASWKHKLNDRWTAGSGFRVYGGDWQAPVEREDWIFTPSASLIYTRDASFSAELGYTYDWVDNVVPVELGTGTTYADGREFTRSIVWLSGKYAF